MRSIRFAAVLAACLILAFSCKNNTPEMSTPTPPPSAQTVVLTPAWSTDTLLTTAESVYYDETYNVLYVSCIGNVPPDAKDGDGFIAKVGLDGKIIDRQWITGLDGPKGMGKYGEYLYIADVTRVVQVDVISGKVLATIEIPGAAFLNDITVDQNGRVYISDTNNNTIYVIDGVEPSVFMQDTLFGGPNGLLVDGDRLIMAAFNVGQVFTITLQDPHATPVCDELPGGDGVVKYGNNFLISNWNGEIYAVSADWKKEKVLDTKVNNKNAADIAIIPNMKLVLVPTFFGNTVDAYRISTE